VRSLRFLPLTLLAGQHGFALFAPYLLVFVLLVMSMPRRTVRA
jgi:hypothetical protein